jgi:hypothetical protein
MSFIVCGVLCAVLFERFVLFCVICIVVCCTSVVPLPSDKNLLAVQVNDNNNNNNNNNNNKTISCKTLTLYVLNFSGLGSREYGHRDPSR